MSKKTKAIILIACAVLVGLVRGFINFFTDIDLGSIPNGAIVIVIIVLCLGAIITLSKKDKKMTSKIYVPNKHLQTRHIVVLFAMIHYLE
ncbi:MAG: hypothetical protein FWD05_13035 [Oscillospiraceae bacterium]|nr:hypothetical protein [Oscillospiraceae bacterium]